MAKDSESLSLIPYFLSFSLPLSATVYLSFFASCLRIFSRSPSVHLSLSLCLALALSLTRTHPFSVALSLFVGKGLRVWLSDSDALYLFSFLFRVVGLTQ